jgi:hypothetical protein
MACRSGNWHQHAFPLQPHSRGAAYLQVEFAEPRAVAEVGVVGYAGLPSGAFKFSKVKIDEESMGLTLYEQASTLASESTVAAPSEVAFVAKKLNSFYTNNSVVPGQLATKVRLSFEFYVSACSAFRYLRMTHLSLNFASRTTTRYSR